MYVHVYICMYVCMHYVFNCNVYMDVFTDGMQLTVLQLPSPLLDYIPINPLCCSVKEYRILFCFVVKIFCSLTSLPSFPFISLLVASYTAHFKHA